MANHTDSPTPAARLDSVLDKAADALLEVSPFDPRILVVSGLIDTIREAIVEAPAGAELAADILARIEGEAQAEATTAAPALH